MFAGALGIALVSLTDTISTSTAFAARSGQEIRGNQEMIGIGAANLAAGLFQGFPVSTSGSRTAVAERSGSKTQLTGVTGAVLILLMLVLLPGLFRNLPQPALAAVVITASVSLADIPGTVRLWRQRRTEFYLSLAAFLGVAFLGVLPGIGIAVGLSILNIFRRAWWPYETVIGRVPGYEGFHDISVHPDAKHLPGLVIYRWDAPLFFANVTAVPRQHPAPGTNRTQAAVDRHRGRTDHGRGHHRRGRVARSGPRAERAGYLPGVRRAQAPDPGEDRTVRTDPRNRAAAFLPTTEAAVAAYMAQTGAQWSAGTERESRRKCRGRFSTRG